MPPIRRSRSTGSWCAKISADPPLPTADPPARCSRRSGSGSASGVAGLQQVLQALVDDHRADVRARPGCRGQPGQRGWAAECRPGAGIGIGVVRTWLDSMPSPITPKAVFRAPVTDSCSWAARSSLTRSACDGAVVSAPTRRSARRRARPRSGYAAVSTSRPVTMSLNWPSSRPGAGERGPAGVRGLVALMPAADAYSVQAEHSECCTRYGTLLDR